jgi:hypothetical protein
VYYTATATTTTTTNTTTTTTTTTATTTTTTLRVCFRMRLQTVHYISEYDLDVCMYVCI